MSATPYTRILTRKKGRSRFHIRFGKKIKSFIHFLLLIRSGDLKRECNYRIHVNNKGPSLYHLQFCWWCDHAAHLIISFSSSLWSLIKILTSIFTYKNYSNSIKQVTHFLGGNSFFTFSFNKNFTCSFTVVHIFH